MKLLDWLKQLFGISKPLPNPVFMRQPTPLKPPEPGMKASKDCLDLIRYFEKLQLKAYQDVGGVWTIGYGSVQGVHEGMTITEDEAELFLRTDMTLIENGVLTYLFPQVLKQYQLDGTLSLAFNIGVHAFGGSTLLKYIRSNDFASAAEEFPKWNHVNKIVVDGLTKRRDAERRMFLGLDWRQAIG